MKKILLLFCMAVLFITAAVAQCSAPTHVRANERWNKVNLTWNSSLNDPIDFNDSLTYGTEMSSGIGYNAAGVFSVAVRFPVESLANNVGQYLTHVGFTPWSLTVSKFTIKVWVGCEMVDDTTFNEGTLVSSTIVLPSEVTAGVNNLIRLSTPVQVDGTQEILIAYECTALSGYPAGSGDNVPVVDWYNNLLYDLEHGWMPLTEYSSLAGYSWCISGYFSDLPEITGFNVLRDNVQINDSIITSHSYIDTSVVPETDYCYVVQSVCASGNQNAPQVCVTTPEQPDCSDLIGDGTNATHNVPFNTYYNYSYVQELFTADEINNPGGMLNTISFHYYAADAIVQENLTVYVGQVNKTTFTSTSDWVPASQLTQVYHGDLMCSNENENLVTITLDEPFEYDGNSNLVVAFLNSRGSYENSNDRFYTHTTTAGSTVLYLYNDSNPYNISSPTTGTLSAERNNMQFCFSAYPSCFYPLNVTAGDITADGATISWRKHAEEDSQWEIMVVEAGGDIEDGEYYMATDTFQVVTGLEENVVYDVYVRLYCSDEDQGDWKIIQFRTRCVSEHVGVPYEENFTGFGTGYDAFPYCWHRSTNHETISYPYIISASALQGQVVLFSNASTYSLAASQALDLSEYEAGSLALSFRIANTQTTYGRLDVGTMTDPNDLHTFTLLKSYYPSDYRVLSSFQEETIILPEAYPDLVYVAFLTPKSGNNNSNIVNLTRVKVDYAPTCSSPHSLTITNVEGTSAELQWEEAPVSVESYILAYNEPEQDPVEITVTGNSYLLTGLTQGTEYEVMLYSACSEGSSDTLTGSFTTRTYMECVTADTSFNEITSASPGTSYSLPVNNYYNYSYSQQIYTANEVSPNHTPTVIMGMELEYAGTTDMTDKTNVSVYLAHTSDTAFASTTSWIPISDATLVYEGSLNCVNGWNVFDFDTYFTYNGVDNLVLIVDDNSGDYNSTSCTFNTHTTQGNKSLRCQNDSSNPDPANPPTGTTGTIRNDIKFHTCSDVVPVSCIAPRAFVTEVSPSSISVAWVVNGNESAWNVEYKAASDTEWVSAGSVTTTSYVISGLDPTTQYDIRVQAGCESEWAYTAAQTSCDLVSLPINENFDSYENNAFMDCWTRHYSASAATPAVASAQSISGSKSLYFNCPTAGNYAYAVAPGLESSVEMNDLQVMFYAYTNTAGYFIEVGIMTDPYDITTFVPVGQYNTTAATTWELAEVITSGYSGDGRYVAFRVPQWYANSIYIDDVNIDVIPSCYHVSEFEFDEITPNSVTVSWTVGGEETQWNYLYGPHGSVDIEEDTPISTSDNPLEITGLSPNTLYDVYVQANCGNGDLSRWMHASFRTDCAAMTDLPFVEDFDSYTPASSTYVLPSCWTKINNGSTDSYPYMYSSGAASSPNCLYFYNYSSTSYDDQYAVLPEMDTIEHPINTLMLSFAARSYSTSYPFVLEVGVMTDPTDASTFQLAQTVTINGTTYSDQEVFFTGFEGVGNYIAIKCAHPTSTTYNYGYVDNVVLDIAPDCSPVNHLEVSNIRGASALISWNRGSQGVVESYTLEYSEAGQDAWSVVSNDITETHYLLGGLDPETAYDVRVRTNCSENTESVWVTASFTTQCLSGGTIEIGDGSSTSNYLPSYSFYSYCYTQQIFTTSDIGTATNITSLSWNMSAVTNQRTFDIYLMHTDATSSDAWLPAANAQLMYSGTPNLQVGLNTFNFNTPFAYDGTSNLALIIIDKTGSWSSGNYGVTHTGPTNCTKYIYQDSSPYSITTTPSSGTSSTISSRLDVIFGGNCDDEVTCVAPNVIVTNVTESSADVQWVPGYQETEWEMEYTTVGDSNWVSVSNPTNGLVSISGLNSNTQYQVRMRSICSPGETSENWASVNFRTECGVAAIPFTEDFNSYGTGTTVFPSCWTHANTYSTSTNYPYISATNNFGTTGGSLYYYSSSTTNCWAVTPELGADVNTLAATFYMKGTASNGMIVGVMTNPDSINTFVPVDTVYITTADVFDRYDVYFDNYAGTGRYIAFMNINTTSAITNLDDITIDLLPSCRIPSNMVVSNVEANSLDLSWTENGSAQAWNIQYGETGFELGTGTITPTTATQAHIDNLETGTTYEFYVQSSCGPNDESEWFGPVSATPGSYNMPVSGEMTITSCGAVIYDDGGVDGNYSSSCNGYMIVNPDQPGMMVQVTGTLLAESSSWDYLIIYDGVGSSGTQLYRSTQSTGTQVTIPPTTSTTGPLTIYFHSDGSGNYAGFEIHVTCVEATIPPVECNAPANVTATNITKNSAVIDWTQEGTPVSWTVSYKKADAQTWTAANVTAHPYTITDLDAETAYNVKVTANCDDTTTAESSTVDFTTLPDGVNEYVNSTVIYPNPTTGQFTISNTQCVIERVEVMDVYGKLLNTVEVNDNTAVIDVTNYASGVYFTRIHTDKGMVTKRVVKE